MHNKWHKTATHKHRMQQIYPIIHPQSTLPHSYQQKDQIFCSRLRIRHGRIAPFLSYLSHRSSRMH